MSHYERAYGTGWDSLDREAAIERAYALGVATAMGEYRPEELDAIRSEADSAYETSVVELAFDEGKNEARALEADRDENDADVWTELVGGETVSGDETPTGGRDELPAAVERIAALDRPEPDSTGALDRPGMLERD